MGVGTAIQEDLSCLTLIYLFIYLIKATNLFIIKMCIMCLKYSLKWYENKSMCLWLCWPWGKFAFINSVLCNKMPEKPTNVWVTMSFVCASCCENVVALWDGYMFECNGKRKDSVHAVGGRLLFKTTIFCALPVPQCVIAAMCVMSHLCRRWPLSPQL